MSRRSVLLVGSAALIGAIAAASLAGPASADPVRDLVTTVTCTGPAGTPTTMTLEKETASGGGVHIVGTNDVFNRQGALDLVTWYGFGPPAGLVNSGRMVTCEGISPATGNLTVVYGKITPAS